jgi:O-antigen ligase
VVLSVAVIFISGLPSSVYLQKQVSGFHDRVLEGLSSSARAHDPSTQYRLAEDRTLKPEIGKAPFIGHGFGVPYKIPQGEAGSFEATTGTFYAHEYYLWLMFKGGLLALVVFIGALLPPLLRVLRKPNALGVALGAVTCGLLAISTVAPVPNDVPGALLFGGVLGALAAATAVRSPGHHAAPPPGEEGALPDGSSHQAMASTGVDG